MLSRVNTTLMRPPGRDMDGVSRGMQVWFNDVVDQFIDLGDVVNDLITQLIELIATVQQGTKYNIFYADINEEGVTQIEILDDEGESVSYEYGRTIVFVDKRCQTRKNFSELADDLGNYRFIKFTDPLPYDSENTPPGPEVMVVYIKKV